MSFPVTEMAQKEHSLAANEIEPQMHESSPNFSRFYLLFRGGYQFQEQQLKLIWQQEHVCPFQPGHQWRLLFLFTNRQRNEIFINENITNLAEIALAGKKPVNSNFKAMETGNTQYLVDFHSLRTCCGKCFRYFLNSFTTEQCITRSLAIICKNPLAAHTPTN